MSSAGSGDVRAQDRPLFENRGTAPTKAKAEHRLCDLQLAERRYDEMQKAVRRYHFEQDQVMIGLLFDHLSVVAPDAVRRRHLDGEVGNPLHRVQCR